MTDYAAAPALLAAAQETIRQLADENAALLAANTRLRGERDRARDLAVRSGIFESGPPRSRTGFKIDIDGQRHFLEGPYCAGDCTTDGNREQWPCPTVRAITDALAGES